MAEIWGQSLTRKEMLRHVGSLDQLFGIRPVLLGGGKETMLRCLEVHNGGGLQLTIAESCAMDLLQLSWRGMPLGFTSKAGIHAPWLSDYVGMSYRRSLGAGFLYTAGLSNVGGACEEETEYHYAHGALKTTPAEHVSARMEWQGDDCTLIAEGEVRESAFFGRNLLLHRTISTRVGSRSVTIRDRLENQDFSPVEIMLLYHMNLGYPLLDDGAELLLDPVHTEALSEHTREDPDWRRMIPPIDGNEEYLYAHQVQPGPDGFVHAAVFNPRLGFGLELRYRSELLRYLIEWKCMRSGDYALGVLPSTCKPIGRTAAAEAGQLTTLQPLEPVELELGIRILESRSELSAPWE